jgi:hypothetical protein
MRACAALAVVTLLASLLVQPVAAGPSALAVHVDRLQIETKLGKTFEFRSTIRNGGSTTATGMIAHLNVLSFSSSVYVDPEDWSSNRTRYLAAIPAGGSVTIHWRVEAVNAGRFAAYVAVLSADRAPVAGPDVHVRVTERRTLDSGGILPLALGVPALLGLSGLGIRMRRGRSAVGDPGFEPTRANGPPSGD